MPERCRQGRRHSEGRFLLATFALPMQRKGGTCPSAYLSKKPSPLSTRKKAVRAINTRPSPAIVPLYAHAEPRSNYSRSLWVAPGGQIALRTSDLFCRCKEKVEPAHRPISAKSRRHCRQARTPTYLLRRREPRRREAPLLPVERGADSAPAPTGWPAELSKLLRVWCVAVAGVSRCRSPSGCTDRKSVV